MAREAIRSIRKLAAFTGKRLLSIGYQYPWCDLNRVALDPLHFPGYFQNAAFVVTNMFHGTVFSIKYNRPFGVLDSVYRSQKISGLLQPLGLLERVGPEDGSALIRAYGTPIEYQAVSALLREESGRSLQFLKQSLGALPGGSNPSTAIEAT